MSGEHPSVSLALSLFLWGPALHPWRCQRVSSPAAAPAFSHLRPLLKLSASRHLPLLLFLLSSLSSPETLAWGHQLANPSFCSPAYSALPKILSPSQFLPLHREGLQSTFCSLHLSSKTSSIFLTDSHSFGLSLAFYSPQVVPCRLICSQFGQLFRHRDAGTASFTGANHPVTSLFKSFHLIWQKEGN